MDFTVSEASTTDLPHLLASVRGLFQEDAGSHDPLTDTSWPEHSGAAYYEPLLADENSLCLLAFSGPAAAGHLIGRIRSGDPLRPGVVTAVPESLTAYAANEAAVAFYRRHGFAPFELTLRQLP